MTYLEKHTYTKNAAIRRMNALGKAQKPYFFLITFDASKAIIIDEIDIDSQELKYTLNESFKESKLAAEKIIIEKKTISQLDYAQAFAYVQSNIKRGYSFLTNLTCATSITMNVDLPNVYQKSQAKHKLWLKDYFVCFSPESFVTIDTNGKIASFPMKGTIDATLPNADLLILNDKKELYEHTTIVDLIRNDLSLVADKVWVERFRFIEKIKKHDGGELLQVSSEIVGQLAHNWRENMGTIIFKMLPAGSISGAPKDSTIEIINTAEKKTYPKNQARGYYTGVFGEFNGESLETAVAIRFIEQGAEGLLFKSGGGITAMSQVEKEYEEMIQKIYVPII